MASSPRVGIVIPVHGQSRLTRNVLEELLAQRDLDRTEIVVVDDASPDDTRAVLEGFGDRIRTVLLDRNAGFAAACNAGARAVAADATSFVFMNNDIVPTHGWLPALTEYVAAHERVGIAGSKLLFPDETIQHAGVVVCEDLIPRHVYAGFPGDHPAVCRSRRFQIVTAGCALVRRDVFERLGAFDEAFVNGYEDVDLCLRANAAGHEVHYVHTSVLYHFESLSRVEAAENRNRQLYLERWGDTLAPDELSTYLADGLIEIERGLSYPLRFRISPQLATIDLEGRAGEADRLLAQRARMSLKLLRETIRLKVRLGEIPEVGSTD